MLEKVLLIEKKTNDIQEKKFKNLFFCNNINLFHLNVRVQSTNKFYRRIYVSFRIKKFKECIQTYNKKKYEYMQQQYGNINLCCCVCSILRTSQMYVSFRFRVFSFHFCESLFFMIHFLA